ncbi:MAG: hypothetical protein P4M11_08675 [Candidatus Pacebacteria bacterium]|nr:hypothetical protein [Candidatus Paceibacterota bacterium]
MVHARQLVNEFALNSNLDRGVPVEELLVQLRVRVSSQSTCRFLADIILGLTPGVRGPVDLLKLLEELLAQMFAGERVEHGAARGQTAL